MLSRIAIVALLFILISSSASAWDVSEVVYNATTNEMVIHYSFSTFELLYSFFIGGGEYTKSVTSEFINGNYSVIEAGYSDVVLNIYGNVTFTYPVNITVLMGNESYYIVNVTTFNPH